MYKTDITPYSGQNCVLEKEEVSILSKQESLGFFEISFPNEIAYHVLCRKLKVDNYEQTSRSN